MTFIGDSLRVSPVWFVYAARLGQVRQSKGRARGDSGKTQAGTWFLCIAAGTPGSTEVNNRGANGVPLRNNPERAHGSAIRGLQTAFRDHVTSGNGILRSEAQRPDFDGVVFILFRVAVRGALRAVFYRLPGQIVHRRSPGPGFAPKTAAGAAKLG
jgi:hypothetical protein